MSIRKYFGLAVLILSLTFVGTWGYTGSPPATIWSEFPAVSDINAGNFNLDNVSNIDCSEGSLACDISSSGSSGGIKIEYSNTGPELHMVSNEADIKNGPLDLNGSKIKSLADPTNDSDAVTLSYFQSNDSFEADNYLPDDPASSDVNMNGYQIGSLADPTNDSDALTLGYFNDNDGVTGKDSGSSLGDGTTINWGSNLSATLSSGEFTVDASSGGSGDTTVNVFDSGTFQGEASDLDFSTDLSVSFSGDTATVSSTASGGSSDTDTMMVNLPETKLPPTESIRQTIKVPSDTWTIQSGGIIDNQFSSPDSGILKIRNEYDQPFANIDTTRKENINAKMFDEFVVFKLENESSSDTIQLGAYVEVIK